jgi:hypothetical protein
VRIAESIDVAWYGWDFWYVATELQIPPAVLASTWSPDEVAEEYLYLRIKYLREAPGGA